ncbi:MAG: dephospho-CoA kinase [Agromyces sp.]
MLLIGLTGGIASGKSTVARRFAEHGARIIDADQLAREAVAPGSPGLHAVRARFGDGVISAAGALDRAALGALVFEHAELRSELESIVHPEVQRLFQQRLTEIQATEPHAVIVYDVPLLVEAASAHPYDLVVVAIAGASVQAERLTTIRGLSSAEAQARISAQASDAERIARADVVIDTSGSLAHTVEQVDALWADRIAELR